MKLYILLALLSFNSINTALANFPLEIHESRFFPDAIVRQLFEMLRRLVLTGDSIKGIPPMDPLVFEKAEMVYPGEILRLETQFINGTISGAGAFQLNLCEFNKDDISVNLEIRFPYLSLDAEHYELFGDIWEAVPLKGIGNFHLELSNITLRAILYLRQSDDGKSILLGRLQNAHFVVQQVSSQIDFDGVIDEIFNDIIGDHFARYITRANGLILHTYSDSFILRLNKYLAQYETWRMLAVIL